MAIINSAITAPPVPDPTLGAGVAAPTNTSAPAASPLNGPMATPGAPTTSTPPTSIVAAPSGTGVAQLGNPQGWAVTPDQTVEGRIQSIINANNPIIQMARTKALETANGRGLLNSSMAAQAGEAAAFGAATPIATADAATAAKAASYNADEANQFGIKNQDALNTRGTAQLNADTQKQLQQIQAQNQLLLQTNNQAATAFNQAQVAITNINMNDKMDANAKTQAIAQVQRELQNQLRVLSSTSGLNLTSQLNFAGYDGFDGSGNYVGFGGAGGAGGSGGSGSGPIIGASAPGLPPGIPSAGATPTGQALPAYSSTGAFINWQQPGVQRQFSGGTATLLDAYQDYAAHMAPTGPAPRATPAEWYDRYFAHPATGESGGN